MTIVVDATDDAAEAVELARAFLASRPAEHQLVLTLLAQRADDPRPGRYWVARDGGDVGGVTFLSPLDFYASITPAPHAVVDAFVQAVADDVPALVGVNGEASTVARFAGEWAARRRVGVTPEEAQRLYRLDALRPPHEVPGALRLGHLGELELLARWAEGFRADTGDGPRRPPEEVRSMLRTNLDEARLFVWDHGGPRSMAVLSRTVERATRVQHVYTPPESRARGFASACVAAVSAHALAAGTTTCVLYTQLSNPTSNAIYRAIGYVPVAEVLRYRFG